MNRSHRLRLPVIAAAVTASLVAAGCGSEFERLRRLGRRGGRVRPWYHQAPRSSSAATSP